MRQAIKDGIINKFNFHLVGVEITDKAVREEYDRVAEELKEMLKTYGGFEKVMRLPATDPGKCKVLLSSQFNHGDCGNPQGYSIKLILRYRSIPAINYG